MYKIQVVVLKIQVVIRRFKWSFEDSSGHSNSFEHQVVIRKSSGHSKIKWSFENQVVIRNQEVIQKSSGRLSGRPRYRPRLPKQKLQN